MIAREVYEYVAYKYFASKFGTWPNDTQRLRICELSGHVNGHKTELSDQVIELIDYYIKQCKEKSNTMSETKENTDQPTHAWLLSFMFEDTTPMEAKRIINNADHLESELLKL
jgi:hypothetical protein